MRDVSISAPDQTENVLGAVNKSIDIIFDRAPVMMHSLDRSNRLVKVNRQWLQRLGYRKGEVLGRKATDFLTDESRSQAVKDCLPLFRPVGSARSVGCQFVERDGRVVDVLLDAEVVPDSMEGCFAIAALREGHDHTQWEQASTTIEALKELTRMRHNLEKGMSPGGGENPGPQLPVVPERSPHALEAVSTREVVASLLENAKDISVNLRGMLKVQEEWHDSAFDQQQEMLIVAKSIDRSLRHLADAMTAKERE